MDPMTVRVTTWVTITVAMGRMTVRVTTWVTITVGTTVGTGRAARTTTTPDTGRATTTEFASDSSGLRLSCRGPDVL
jgi:hypothetical protein